VEFSTQNQLITEANVSTTKPFYEIYSTALSVWKEDDAALMTLCTTALKEKEGIQIQIRIRICICIRIPIQIQFQLTNESMQ